MYPKDLMDQAIEQAQTKQTKERFTTSYVARQSYKPGHVVKPPTVPNVLGAIDTHCHAHQGQQDALALAKHASKNDMGGILFKTIAGNAPPAEAVRQVDEELRRWCDEEKIAPTRLWSAYGVGRGWSDISYKEVQKHLDDGCSAVWMPVFTHANTLCKVATNRPDPENPERFRLQGPVGWEEATKIGHYTLDEKGRLLPEVRDILHLVADRDAVLSLGHVGREEQVEMVEEIERIGFKKCFIDHPYSPFIALTREEMKRFAASGVYMNFTYDELSPLLGTNPLEMFGAVAEIGVDHVLLSSDAGEPLFPDSVECMRLMRAYGEAFGMTSEEVYQASAINPARLLGAE